VRPTDGDLHLVTDLRLAQDDGLVGDLAWLDPQDDPGLAEVCLHQGNAGRRITHQDDLAHLGHCAGNRVKRLRQQEGEKESCYQFHRITWPVLAREFGQEQADMNFIDQPQAWMPDRPE
jgi:hypothetical protein